jgi:hypothetical protein
MSNDCYVFRILFEQLATILTTKTDIRKKIIERNITNTNTSVIKDYLLITAELPITKLIDNIDKLMLKIIKDPKPIVIVTLENIEPENVKTGEGHFVMLIFNKLQKTVSILDSGTDKLSTTYSIDISKNLIPRVLKNYGYTLRNEYVPKNSCQINFSTMGTALHVDNYCQTWSILLAIEYINKGDLKTFTFPKSDKHLYDSLMKNDTKDRSYYMDKKRLKILLELVRKYILSQSALFMDLLKSQFRRALKKRNISQDDVEKYVTNIKDILYTDDSCIEDIFQDDE